jgi:myo-inositol-1(or 4)-monophosphatase
VSAAAAPSPFLRIARRIARRASGALSRAGGREEVGRNPLGQTAIRADRELEDIAIGELSRAKIPCVLATEESGLVEISRKPRWRFVLDPLDGSENFKRGMPIYAMGICYAPEGGRVKDIKESCVIELARGDEFYARAGTGVYRNGVRAKASAATSLRGAIVSIDLNGESAHRRVSSAAKLALLECRDTRRFGPDLVDMCYAACGGVDGFVDARGTLSAVHASGFAILRENCVASDVHGGELDCALEVEEFTGVVAAGTRKLHSRLVSALRK